MSEQFDPYHEWLGIPADEQPPSHYRLLGIPALEASPSVIENAADQRMSHLRTFQTGQHSALSQKLLNEVATAKVCLFNPAKKAAYDQQFQQGLPPSDSTPAMAADFLDALSQPHGPVVSRPRKKRPSAGPMIAVAGVVVVVGIAVVWWAASTSAPPSNEGPAKAEVASPVKATQDVLPKPPRPSEKPAPIAARPTPKEEPKAEVPQAAPVSKPPEPEAMA